MKTRDWHRQEQIAQVRSRIWRYLSPAARPERDVLLEAGHLLHLPDADALSIGRVHFLLSNEVATLLNEMPRLLRHLATRSEEEEEWSTERVRGSIRWGRTLSARLSLSMPTLFVTAPAIRAYRTPENELLAFVLGKIVELAERTTWLERGGASAEILRQRYKEAQRWRHARVLESIPAERPSAQALARIRIGRRRRRYRSVLAAYELLVALIERADRVRLQRAVEDRALVPADDATLFEVRCAFDLIDAIASAGWTSKPLGVFEGGLHFTANRDDEVLDFWYQEVPKELSQRSRYRAVQRLHGFGSAIRPLRPDVILRRTGHLGSQWLLVEMKMGGATGAGRTVEDSARAALHDLLAYRRDFEDVFRGDEPYGLGIAWGSDLQVQRGEVMLSTPDTLAESVSGFLR